MTESVCFFHVWRVEKDIRQIRLILGVEGDLKTGLERPVSECEAAAAAGAEEAAGISVDLQAAAGS